MIQPDTFIETLNDLCSRHCGSITLELVVKTIEETCRNTRSVSEEDEFSLVFVAGKFENDQRKLFQVGIYPSYSLFQPVEILLSYSRSWRNWFSKKCRIEVLEFSDDGKMEFGGVYATNWFRMYKKIHTDKFVCRVKTQHELGETARNLIAAFGSGL